jgi:hypothetical protein
MEIPVDNEVPMWESVPDGLIYPNRAAIRIRFADGRNPSTGGYNLAARRRWYG